jgi:hypothetical protein
MSKWDAREEDYLKKLERQCNAYYRYFSKDFMYYKWASTRFNVPILVLSSINALCAISLNDFLDQKYVSILNAILSAGTGLIGSIQLYLKINDKMANSARSSILMKRIALVISKELSIMPESRVSEGKIFLQECFADFNAALEQSNPVCRKFKNYLALDPEEVIDSSTDSETPSTTRSQKILNYFRMAKPIEYSEP